MSQDLFSDSQLFASQEDEPNRADGSGSDGSDAEEAVEQSFSQTSANGLTADQPLIRTDLSEDVITEHKQVFVDIALKTKEVENNSLNICDSAKQLTEQITRQDKAFKSGGVNENMTLDAKAILTNTNISLQLVKRLQTDSKQFNSIEFAEKLLVALDPFNHLDENTDPNNTGNTCKGFEVSDWSDFGLKRCHFHRVLPTFDYIHGSFDSTPDESTQPKQPKARVRHQKPVLSTQTGATQIDPNSKQTEDSTPEEVELILNTVKKLEKKNNDLPYIEVIANPKSIAETVENIFHSTFLIKDGLARLVSDRDGGPVIQSIDNSEIDVTQPEKGIQSVFSFTMKDWKRWVDKYSITRPAIRHPKKATQK